MSDEELELEISDRDAEFMLQEGLIEKNEKGELWLTKKGEEFIRRYMDEAIARDSGDAE